jgi:hypothetical protein
MRPGSVIGFHCSLGDLQPDRLLPVLSSAPAEVEWVGGTGAANCRAGDEEGRLRVVPEFWVNLWVESAAPGLLAGIEEALVWALAAAPAVLSLPERLAWVTPLLGAGEADVRALARAVVSGRCQAAASVMAQDFEAAARGREAALAAAAELARRTGRGGDS